MHYGGLLIYFHIILMHLMYLINRSCLMCTHAKVRNLKIFALRQKQGKYEAQLEEKKAITLTKERKESLRNLAAQLSFCDFRFHTRSK